MWGWLVVTAIQKSLFTLVHGVLVLFFLWIRQLWSHSAGKTQTKNKAKTKTNLLQLIDTVFGKHPQHVPDASLLLIHLTLNWLITSGKSQPCESSRRPPGSCPQFSKYCTHTHTHLCASMYCAAQNKMHGGMSHFIRLSQWITLHTATNSHMFTHK